MRSGRQDLRQNLASDEHHRLTPKRICDAQLTSAPSRESGDSPIANAISPLKEWVPMRLCGGNPKPRSRPSRTSSRTILGQYRRTSSMRRRQSATPTRYSAFLVIVVWTNLVSAFTALANIRTSYATQSIPRVSLFRGNWNLAGNPRAVAVVGTRNPSEEGLQRARKLVRRLVEDGVFVCRFGEGNRFCSSYHRDRGRRANDRGDRYTPISEVYPKENAALQMKSRTSTCSSARFPSSDISIKVPTAIGCSSPSVT